MHDANYELIKTYFSVHFGSSSLFVSARFLWQAAGMKEEPRESWENKYFFLYFWLSPLRIISITHWTLFSLWVSMQSYNQDFQWNFIPSSASFSYYKIALSLDVIPRIVFAQLTRVHSWVMMISDVFNEHNISFELRAERERGNKCRKILLKFPSISLIQTSSRFIQPAKSHKTLVEQGELSEKERKFGRINFSENSLNFKNSSSNSSSISYPLNFNVILEEVFCYIRYWRAPSCMINIKKKSN